MGAFEPCFYFILETTALQYTTASQAGVVFAFLPIFIIIFGSAFFRERPTVPQCTGGLIATIGVIVLCLCGAQSESAIAPAKGNFLELLAMVCAAGYTLLLKKLSGNYSPFLLAAIQSFIGTIFLFPLGVVKPRPTRTHQPANHHRCHLLGNNRYRRRLYFF